MKTKLLLTLGLLIAVQPAIAEAMGDKGSTIPVPSQPDHIKLVPYDKIFERSALVFSAKIIAASPESIQYKVSKVYKGENAGSSLKPTEKDCVGEYDETKDYVFFLGSDSQANRLVNPCSMIIKSGDKRLEFLK